MTSHPNPCKQRTASSASGRSRTLSTALALILVSMSSSASYQQHCILGGVSTSGHKLPADNAENYEFEFVARLSFSTYPDQTCADFEGKKVTVSVSELDQPIKVGDELVVSYQFWEMVGDGVVYRPVRWRILRRGGLPEEGEKLAQ